jgi:hypothetical protein
MIAEILVSGQPTSTRGRVQLNPAVKAAAAALALFVLCGCDPRATGFRNEMRRRSSDFGLALGYIGGTTMGVYPLEGVPTTSQSLENYSGPCRRCGGWFSSDGKLVVWNVLWPDWKADEPSLLVRTITGQTIAKWSGLLNTPYALAVSPDRSRVALEAINHYPGAPATGLAVRYFGHSEPRSAGATAS